MAKLTTAQPLGMLRNLEVSKGDQITVRVKGYYAGAPTNNQAIDWGVVLSNLSQSGGNANSGEISSQNSPFLLNLGLSITPNGGNPDNAVPSGYLKSVFYKHDGTPVVASLKLKHLQAGAGQWQTLELSYTAPDRGYVQVFVANESDQTVYFDDLEVEHTPQLIVQENHYYPFGMNLAGIEKLGKPEHRFQYNGKEKQEEFGLNWLDYGARNYDAVLGRWNGIDPLAEKNNTTSPYGYVLNNPMKFIDPDGRDNVIYLVNVGGHEKGKEPDLYKIAQYANMLFDKIGLETRVAIFSGKAKNFNYNLLDATDGVAFIGSPENIVNNIFKISPKMAEQYSKPGAFVFDKNNPEKSFLGGSKNDVQMNVIAIAHDRSYNMFYEYGFNQPSKENANKVSGYNIVHGAGHNAGVGQRNEYGYKTEHPGAGVMIDGNLTRSERNGRPLMSVLDPKVEENIKYKQVMEAHFGTNKANPTYRKNNVDHMKNAYNYYRRRNQAFWKNQERQQKALAKWKK